MQLHSLTPTQRASYNFYDAKWAIYLDFPFKFIVIFGNFSLFPFFVVSRFNSIFVGAIFIYLFSFGSVIDRKSLIFNICMHTAIESTTPRDMYTTHFVYLAIGF